MSELRTKSPRENIASRQAESKPNFGHPGTSAERSSDSTRAQAELADGVQTHSVVSVDATVLRAAMVTALSGSASVAAARTDAANALTDVLVAAGITATVKPVATLTAAR